MLPGVAVVIRVYLDIRLHIRLHDQARDVEIQAVDLVIYILYI
jgi:hypothetical protein